MMKPRKFVGATTRDVLRQVRDALGPDALILSNAKVPGGIEVVAMASSSINEIVSEAVGEETVPEPVYAPPPARGAVPKEPRPEAETSFLRRLTSREARSAPAPAPARPAAVVRDEAPVERMPEMPRREAVREAAPRESVRAPERPPAGFDSLQMPPLAAAVPPSAPAHAPAAPARESVSEAMVQGMVAELRSMRAVLEQRLFGLAWTELSRRDPAKVAALQTLLTAGFSGELARRLTDPMPESIDDQEGSRWLVAEINRNLLTAGSDNDIVERGGVYAIVGPTGVGKTTTTAKLAARGVVRHGADRVALLTTDTYRIGAHEQLRIYGRILGVTTSVVRDANELKATLTELRGKHMVLIDTIGMSQRDKMVAEQVSALARCGGNVKRLLLLNATCNGDTLEDVVRCYEPGSIDGCILTKLDEAQSIGAAMDVIIRNRLALHFVANGQRVPEDLHVPNRQYLIHRALRASQGSSVFGLSHEEFPLLLGGQCEVAAAAPAPAGGSRG
jgi:flagellar biosynthesis protein FlhF